ncbi:LuxR C-terminal-related transcriptional regulator, partial [Massilia horti]
RWREGGRAPLALDAGAQGEHGQWLRAAGFDNLLVHGSSAAGADASVFALFGLPMRPGARHAYFLELLLPCLHLALAGLPAVPGPGLAPPRPLSRREAQVVQWLREGKSNAQIGALLGISTLTVKNHLQRIYKVLGVGNRAHALARCLELRLLDG